MTLQLTHASFFSGAGGTDLGLEAAGWHTVSFSEIDPYASAVLAERWPDTPNLGDITALGYERGEDDRRVGLPQGAPGLRGDADPQRLRDSADWQHATLWSGGFPCQDLSVAGKRAGFTNDDGSSTRSGLAFAFLALVAAHRPPLVLLENVPGLLSSAGGRDFHKLINTFQELGYVGTYRVLDARHFGVPQRRRRVFIVAIDARTGVTAKRTAAVLALGSRCAGHPATGTKAGPEPADGAGDGTHGPGIYNATAGFGGWEPGEDAYNLSQRDYKSSNHLLVSPSPDTRGVRAPDGLAPGLDDRSGVGAEAELIKGGEASYHQRDRIYGDLAPSLDSHSHSPSDPPIVAFAGGGRGRRDRVAVTALAPTLRVGAHTNTEGGPGDTVPVIAYMPHRTLQKDGSVLEGFAQRDISDALHLASGNKEPLLAGSGLTTEASEDPLLPPGLDSNRYRCCGNGVVAPVAEWLGERLAGLAQELGLLTQ